MKNNLKFIFISFVLIMSSTSLSANNEWDRLVNDIDGVHVARVILPKYVTARYNKHEKRGTLEEPCLSVMKLSATFIDAQTKKKIKFYDLDNLWADYDPVKQEMIDDLFHLDSPYYETLILKTTTKSIIYDTSTTLIDKKIVNQYKLKPYGKKTILKIYYRIFKCNGYTYKIFLGYSDERFNEK